MMRTLRPHPASPSRQVASIADAERELAVLAERLRRLPPDAQASLVTHRLESRIRRLSHETRELGRAPFYSQASAVAVGPPRAGTHRPSSAPATGAGRRRRRRRRQSRSAGGTAQQRHRQRHRQRQLAALDANAYYGWPSSSSSSSSLQPLQASKNLAQRTAPGPSRLSESWLEGLTIEAIGRVAENWSNPSLSSWIAEYGQRAAEAGGDCRLPCSCACCCYYLGKPASSRRSAS
eukprot:COSAG01_NODE_13385_length_1593_cov_2.233601_1_plen_235_part_00